ncbi:MAG: 5'/3'-nucleotidase SurE [Vampirovibrionales bacterium]
MMKLLLANDDGIHAQGLQALAKALATEHELYILAPHQERSANGHAITLVTPLRAEPAPSFPAKHALACAINGTPADCVKLGLTELLKEVAIDWVLSGINHGSNLGGDIIYSGTVAAALEGALNGVPAMAFSLVDGQHADANFTAATSWIAEHLPTLIRLHQQAGFDARTAFNINFPPSQTTKAYQALAYCTLADRMYTDFYAKCQDPRGGHYYWLAGDPLTHTLEQDSDVTRVFQGHVTLSPIHASLLNVTALERLNTLI